MEEFSVTLNDLPDEILLIILRKLNNVEVLYSLMCVNKRLNTIAHDSIFTNYLTLFQRFSNNSIHPLPHPILDRFLSQSLPSIHNKIKWLNLETSSMERILLAGNYLNLYGLGLYGIDVNKVISLFTDHSVFTHVITNQISSLVIDINENKKQLSSVDVSTFVFPHIFTMFISLQYLKLGPPLNWLSFDISPPTHFYSSTLLELHVYVTDFTDCLYLLDGRFNQLHTFHVNIFRIRSNALTINNEEKLPNLRCFLLHSVLRTSAYDELIVPLLHRMLNLEKLDLNLKIDRKKGLVDGNNLKENLTNHMVRLNKLTFNICSFTLLPSQFNLQSNEDTFKNGLTNNEIISCVDYFPERNFRYCHIYSYPYTLDYYHNISNNFPGGLFKNVVEISLYDERPFEHDFFCQIQNSFPFIRKLDIRNYKPQKYKKSSNGSVIKYPHLDYLTLIQVHDDYMEEFLLDTNMCLPNNVYLSADDESLERVTHNFKRDATRSNCAKVNYSCTRFYHGCEHLKGYFLHVDIDLF